MHSLVAGDTITIPKGVPHQFWNGSSTETVETVVTFTPALKTEIFLEQFYGLSNDNRTKADGTPAFLQLMVMAREYDITVAGSLLRFQRLLWFVLGSIGRMAGYKKYYPKYSQGNQ